MEREAQASNALQETWLSLRVASALKSSFHSAAIIIQAGKLEPVIQHGECRVFERFKTCTSSNK